MSTLDMNGRWSPENRGALETMLAKSFRERPIAIFDWDNTCIAGDTSDMVFHQLCRDLAFRFEHPDFGQWVEEIPVPTRILECVEMYWAEPSFEARAALRFELERTRWALHESEDDNQAWAWDSGAFVGWTPDEVREYTRRVIAQELAEPIGKELLTHPAHMHAEAIGAGAVKHDLSGLHYLERARQMRSMEWDAELTLPLARGLRARAEMRELVGAMQGGGWDVFVITASPQWEIEAFAELYGIPHERVIGMRRAVADGLITSEIESPCSWGDGKLDAFNMFVARDRMPTFCAGDSVGDWTLLEWATDCALLVEPTVASLRDFAGWKKSLGETWLIQAFD